MSRQLIYSLKSNFSRKLFIYLVIVSNCLEENGEVEYIYYHNCEKRERVRKERKKCGKEGTGVVCREHKDIACKML